MPLSAALREATSPYFAAPAPTYEALRPVYAAAAEIALTAPATRWGRLRAWRRGAATAEQSLTVLTGLPGHIDRALLLRTAREHAWPPPLLVEVAYSANLTWEEAVRVSTQGGPATVTQTLAFLRAFAAPVDPPGRLPVSSCCRPRAAEDLVDLAVCAGLGLFVDKAPPAARVVAAVAAALTKGRLSVTGDGTFTRTEVLGRRWAGD